MKKRKSYDECLQLVSCTDKRCKYWKPVRDFYDLEELVPDDGICSAGFITIINGRCAMFKYVDAHILPLGQKVLE